MVKRHLVQILLPLMTGQGQRLGKSWFDAFMRELTQTFGGATSFARAPGDGLWDSGGQSENDQIAVVEVMTETLDEAYWRRLKTRLEKELAQEEIAVRSLPITTL